MFISRTKVKAATPKEDFMDGKNLHGVLHGGLWIRFHGPLQILGDRDFF